MAAPGSLSPSTASQPPPLALAERADVHKSCKAVEGLLGIFNEYCEAIGAVSALHKRLAKALRETAGMRGTGEVAVNAMGAAATIFEALAEVDSKFGKAADKEYDSVSTEVKKWFKRLAKEERNHDEKMSNANAKIKQAGQNYEKKSKKKAMDVSDEHARYISLISTLGPEMAQEKYNHALTVTQRHNSTIQSVAACLARLADAEWTKACESVRRAAPTVGALGQWRALCEGGWTGDLPADLPSDSATASTEPAAALDDRASGSSSSGGLKPIQEELQQKQPGSAQRTPEMRELELPRAPPGYSTGPSSAAASAQDLHDDPNISQTKTQIHPQARAPQRQTPATLAPPEPTTLARAVHSSIEALSAHVDPNTGSVRSLSAFPSPPTHFPIPPPRAGAVPQASSNLQFPSGSGALAESPVSAHSELDDSFRTANQHFGSVSPPAQQDGRPRGYSRTSDEDVSARPEVRRPVPVKAHTSLPAEDARHVRGGPLAHQTHRPSASADLAALRYPRERPYEEEEFGMIDAGPGSPGKAKTVGYPRATPMERTDTSTSSATGSLVAAMRNRYSFTSGSISPPPKELPRMPVSVNDLASRYEGDAPLSPRLRAASPPVTRQQSLPLIDTAARTHREGGQQERILSPTHRIPQGVDEERRNRQQQQQQQQQQRSADVMILERKAKEQELHAREQELEARSRELERERARLHSLREDSSDGGAPQTQFALRPRERRISLRHQLQRPLSQMELGPGDDRASNGNGGTNARQPQKMHLVAPPHSPVKPLGSPQRTHAPQSPLASPRMDRTRDRDRRPESPSPTSATATAAGAGHASNCGCEACSVSKYGAPAQHQRVDSKPDKPRSWMRRLSMPVGNALGLDSKRHQGSGLPASGGTTNFALGSGVGNTPAGGGGRGLFSMDGKKNASTTALAARPQESARDDGRARGGLFPGRRGHEASGVSNRSMTNLGIAGRH